MSFSSAPGWTVESITERATLVAGKAEALGLADVGVSVKSVPGGFLAAKVRAVVLASGRCVWSAGDHGERCYSDELAAALAEEGA